MLLTAEELKAHSILIPLAQHSGPDFARLSMQVYVSQSDLAAFKRALLDILIRERD